MGGVVRTDRCELCYVQGLKLGIALYYGKIVEYFAPNDLINNDFFLGWGDPDQGFQLFRDNVLNVYLQALIDQADSAAPGGGRAEAKDCCKQLSQSGPRKKCVKYQLPEAEQIRPRQRGRGRGR
jgi:hypothetical protein